MSLYFTDQYNKPITFLNDSLFYIKVNVFNYRISWLDVILSDVRNILKIYILKNFKRDVEPLEDPQSEEK